jgi:para-nitrobenzyl esterase
MKSAIPAGALLMAVLAATAVGGSLDASASTLGINTSDGKVRGKSINRGKVSAFLGIPYAAPPVGQLRFRPPQPALPWKSERDATQFGHHCAQNHVFDDMVFQDSAAPEDPGSEDCLTLNVYVPAEHKGANLPVMFWIHGGGYAGGASSEPRHNGDFLPLKGVMLVTINYRLGVFGFLTLPELDAEQGGASGNYGLMDMVAALTWVKKNAAVFGGDPNNVTIFGESAGSSAVSTLMAVPSARGLFHRAIGESGGALDGGTVMETSAAAGAKNENWAKGAGINSLKELRAMSTSQLLAAAAGHKVASLDVVVDGRFVTEPVLDAYNAGKQAKVPLLAGFNHDERVRLANGMTAEKWRATVKQRFTDEADANAVLRLYPGANDGEATRSASEFGGDQFIAYDTWKWMEVDRRTGDKDIYRYELDLPAPPSKFHPGSYAFHSDDIEYVFGTLDTRPGAVWRPEDYALSEEMMSYWTNFAETGNPNGVDGHGNRLPIWPKYSSGDPVLHLDNPTVSRPDKNRARYEFWLSKDK